MCICNILPRLRACYKQQLSMHKLTLDGILPVGSRLSNGSHGGAVQSWAVLASTEVMPNVAHVLSKVLKAALGSFAVLGSIFSCKWNIIHGEESVKCMEVEEKENRTSSAQKGDGKVSIERPHLIYITSSTGKPSESKNYIPLKIQLKFIYRTKFQLKKKAMGIS